MEITEFLLARYDEDEADAGQLARDLERWERERRHNGADGSQGSIAVTTLLGTASDPSRVLAECEAKREIVGLYEYARETGQGPGGYLERALGFLALPYAGHPDFREEWRA